MDILNEWGILGGHERKDPLLFPFPSFAGNVRVRAIHCTQKRKYGQSFFKEKKNAVTAAESKIRPSSCVLVSRCGCVTGNQMSFCPCAWPVGSMQGWPEMGFL